MSSRRSTVSICLAIAFVAVVAAVTLSSCASERSPHAQAAENQIDALATALERGDATSTRQLLSRTDSELWDIVPYLGPEQRASIVAGLRSRRFLRDYGSSVSFQATYQGAGGSMTQVFYVRFEPGREGVAF